ncbi:uncharacterized protein LOC123528238 isoform X2 [Mercenaria mercenaria]|nr:uncharacterized protein LOC123528238 isoform X2 [Mercenaria mercenaria]
MPQATNMKVWREKELSPVGPGTVFNRVTEISAATKERALLANKTENARLERIQRLIDKEHRFVNNLQNKVIQRTSKTLTEKRALLQLLQKEYRFDNFVTMKQGFNSNQIEDIETARHYVIESRVFNSGFNLKSMKPEVHRRIRKLDPNHKYKTFKKRLLADVKVRNVEINRTISTPTFYKMLHDHEHWREYNHPSSKEKMQVSHLPEITSAGKREDFKPEVENIDHIAAEEKDTFPAPDTDEGVEKPKEKSMVLERRLARPKQDALSMTMRTLGPVYFQTTVSTEPSETS